MKRAGDSLRLDAFKVLPSRLWAHLSGGYAMVIGGGWVIKPVVIKITMFTNSRAYGWCVCGVGKTGRLAFDRYKSVARIIIHITYILAIIPIYNRFSTGYVLGRGYTPGVRLQILRGEGS